MSTFLPPNLMVLLRALRVNHWTKNAIVFAALIFAMGVGEIGATAHAVVIVTLAAALFCLASSGIYLLNDLKDIEQDRAHPIKKHRPIAAGQLATTTAAFLAVILVVVSLAGAWLLDRSFFGAVAAYIGIQFVYTFLLKVVGLIDVFVIAAGFVLRALGGAVVIDVPISPWLILCTLLLALFLALCKRRHEKVVEEEFADASRPALRSYDEKLLDQLIAIVSSATIVCYALYTLWPDTVEKFGTPYLGFTIPFVIVGLFRYLDLVYRHEKGGRPEKILLTDPPLLIDLALYGICVLLVLFVFR